jgi:6-phosphofructokinase 1
MAALRGNEIIAVDLKEAVSKLKLVDKELFDVAKIFFG